MYPVGTLHAGGKSYFLLDPKPIKRSDAGFTFRCVEKNGPAYRDGSWPVLHVTAIDFAIEQAEEEPSLFDVHDAVLDEYFEE